MFRATTAVLQQVSHLPPASITPCGAGVVASKTQSSLAPGPTNQDSQCAGRVQPHCKQKPGHRASGPGAVHTVPATSGSAHQGLSLLICKVGPQVAAAAVRKAAKFSQSHTVAPPTGTTQESHPPPPPRSPVVL